MKKMESELTRNKGGPYILLQYSIKYIWANMYSVADLTIFSPDPDWESLQISSKYFFNFFHVPSYPIFDKKKKSNLTKLELEPGSG